MCQEAAGAVRPTKLGAPGDRYELVESRVRKAYLVPKWKINYLPSIEIKKYESTHYTDIKVKYLARHK